MIGSMHLPYRFGSCQLISLLAEETHRGEFDRAMQRVGAGRIWKWDGFGERRTRDKSRDVARQSDVAQGCPAGTDEEKRARRPAEGQGGQTPGPHPARVGRRMWQSLSLITHTHTRADATCKDPEDPRMPDTRPPPISARVLRLTRAALCFVRLPSHRTRSNHVWRRRRGGREPARR